HRAAVTTVDQCFASASNFAVGVIVARIAGASGLGAYSVAYTVWLALAATHRAMVTDPMSIENDARHGDASLRLQAGVAAELALAAFLAAAVAGISVAVMTIGQRDVGIALFTLAFFLAPLILQDYWRWVGFMQGRPTQSLLNDTVFNCVQAAMLIALILCGLGSAPVAIAAWGIGAVAGALYGFRQFSVAPSIRGWLVMVRSRWHMSRWLIASGITGWGASQAYPILAAPAIGSAGLGGLRAPQSLTPGPSLGLLQARGNIRLPRATHR